MEKPFFIKMGKIIYRCDGDRHPSEETLKKYTDSILPFAKSFDDSDWQLEELKAHLLGCKRCFQIWTEGAMCAIETLWDMLIWFPRARIKEPLSLDKQCLPDEVIKCYAEGWFSGLSIEQIELFHQLFRHIEDCPQCRKKRGEFLRVYQETQSKRFEEVCPSDSLLEQYVEGLEFTIITIPIKVAIEGHSEMCEHCQQKIEQFEEQERKRWKKIWEAEKKT